MVPQILTTFSFSLKLRVFLEWYGWKEPRVLNICLKKFFFESMFHFVILSYVLGKNVLPVLAI